MKKISKKTLTDIAKMLQLLRQVGQIHIRGIAKALEIHPRTVDRIIQNYLNVFVAIKKTEYFGFRANLVSFKQGKENTQLNDILKYLELKKRIKSSANERKSLSTSSKGVKSKEISSA